MYSGHISMKWNSLSITFMLQYIHFLSLLSILWWWPVSIAKECADILNLVKALRNLNDCITCKYVSRPKSNRMLLSVTNLLEFIICDYHDCYTPRKLCLWWVYCFHVVRACVRPCVRPSVTLCFLNILKSHGWIFIKPCKHVHICKTNTLNKKSKG